MSQGLTGYPHHISYEFPLLQIGYWRYISIYRHLQRNPDNQLYPLFEYFENWCQDENRHGDFFSAILKSQPQVKHSSGYLQLLHNWLRCKLSYYFMHSLHSCDSQALNASNSEFAKIIVNLHWRAKVVDNFLNCNRCFMFCV